jgi:hypothetical protein
MAARASMGIFDQANCVKRHNRYSYNRYGCVVMRHGYAKRFEQGEQRDVAVRSSRKFGQRLCLFGLVG